MTDLLSSMANDERQWKELKEVSCIDDIVEWYNPYSHEAEFAMYGFQHLGYTGWYLKKYVELQLELKNLSEQWNQECE